MGIAGKVEKKKVHIRLSIKISLFPVQRPGEVMLQADPAGNSSSFFLFFFFFGPDTYKVYPYFVLFEYQGQANSVVL